MGGFILLIMELQAIKEFRYEGQRLKHGDLFTCKPNQIKYFFFKKLAIIHVPEPEKKTEPKQTKKK